MITASPELTLTVVSGNSSELMRTFTLGAAVGPISVGTEAEWKIAGAGINTRHLYFAFDGAKLHVAAASPSSRVLLRGRIVEQDWREVEIPSEVHFGTACIIVLSAENTARQGQETGALDDEQLDDEAITVCRECPLSALVADPPTCALAVPASLSVTASATLATETENNPVEVLAPTHPWPLLDSEATTPHDNGALRELASHLASVTAARVAGVESRLEPDELARVRSRVTDPGEIESVATSELAASTRKTPETSNVLKRLVAAWRLATRPQRIICALLPFAFCAGLLSPAAGAPTDAITSGPTLARSSDNTAGVPTTTPPREVPRQGEPAIAVTVNTAEVDTAPVATLSNTVARDLASATRSATPPTTVRAPEPVSALAIAPTAQRDALSAARTGKLSEAADLYHKLAVASQSEVFSKAALLARRQSVRTP